MKKYSHVQITFGEYHECSWMGLITKYVYSSQWVIASLPHVIIGSGGILQLPEVVSKALDRKKH